MCQLCLVLVFGGLLLPILSHLNSRLHKGGEGHGGSSISVDGQKNVAMIARKMEEVVINPTQLSENIYVYQDLHMGCTHEKLQHKEQELQFCKKIKLLLDCVSSEKWETQSTPLFIVPMDYLVLHVRRTTDNSRDIMTAINAVTKGFHYVHFGGSDHIFLCLTNGCRKVMKEILVRHSLGNDTRAMWIGVQHDLEGLREQWPCPDRVLNAPKSLLAGMGLSALSPSSKEPIDELIIRGVGALIQNAVQKIEGTNRWVCAKERWELDLDYTQRDKSKSCIAVVKHKLCVTTIKQCASNTVNQLLMRMSGIPDWDTLPRHSDRPQSNLAYIRPFYNQTAHFGNQTDTTIVKIAVLRDPEDRFLAAYTSRILHRHENWRVGLAMDILTVPTVDEVLDALIDKQVRGELDSVDPHFRPQSAFGNLRKARYDFVASVSSLSQDMETVLKSLNLWEKYGAFGWGGQRNVSFTVYTGDNMKKSKPTEVQLTGSQREKLYSLYYEDYCRFGFPLRNL